MRVEIPVVGRTAAKDVGFTHEDYAAWVDICSSWAYTTGAAEVGFGTYSGNNDDLALHLTFLQPPKDDTILGDVVMRQNVKNHDSPLRLERFDPYPMRAILAGYRRMQQMFLKERDATTKLAEAFKGTLESLIGTRPFINPERMEILTEEIRVMDTRPTRESRPMRGSL